jgi:hypothetical protein
MCVRGSKVLGQKVLSVYTIEKENKGAAPTL